MIVDSSALLAVLFEEPESEAIGRALLAAKSLSISAATLLETSMVFEGRTGAADGADLDEFLRDFNVRIVPFGPDHAELARHAFRTFGKGRHPARLNFGDCISYALAKATGEPLLFKGNDFPLTDIDAVAY